MEIETRKLNKLAMVSVKGRVDATTSPDFENRLSDLIGTGERMILVNFADLEYISSAGLRSILATAKRLKADQGELFFTGLKGPVDEVFRISGFHTIFKIFPSEAEAVTHCASNL